MAIERAFRAHARRANKAPTRVAAERRNLIDVHLFDKMEADGVTAAETSTDEVFLRRVSLDLTGRIPTVEQTEAFLNDRSGDKRQRLIESLLTSEAYVDAWTLFFGNRFEVTTQYYNYVRTQGRNRFHHFLRDFLARDRSYAQVVTEMLTAAGDSQISAPVNFSVRGYAQGDPIQDTWDNLTDRITTRFLGIKTECVSCHDGRRHLEEINLYLTARRREDFWRQAAFLSRMSLQHQALDPFGQQWRTVIADRSSGAYYTVVNPNNPGPRPTRTGGPYEPRFLLTGETPKTGEWRKELARLLTSDRQFARATVNYLWAHMFGEGIVDPPDGWDLERLDPRKPPPAPWPLQASHPELLEALADEFLRSGYRVRNILRLIANSSAYQLSSVYAGAWRPEYSRYFARHNPRRLSAEEVYDAVSRATMTETPMYVEGFDQPLMYAAQLPDPSEPRLDGGIRTFLSNFGRGDWFNIPRIERSTVLQVLYMMNDNAVNFRTFATRDGGRGTRVAWVLQSGMGDTDAIKHLSLATLSLYPTDEELAVIGRNRRGSREQWLSDVQWALLNKLDFLFSQ